MSRPSSLALALCLCALAALAPAGLRAAPRWDPVPPADLAATPPADDPDADAEILTWDAYIDDQLVDFTVHHVERNFKRIKIFTTAGAQAQGQVRILYERRATLSDVSGRTVLPDGSVVPLLGKESFDESLVKKRGVEWRQRSFALPGVVPGAVIEYQYTLKQDDVWSNDSELDLQQDIPVRHVVYHISPLGMTGYRMACRSFNTRIKASGGPVNGYWEFAADSLPAYHEEPLMPPEKQVRAWMLLHYRTATDLNGEDNPERFWHEYGRDQASDFDEWTHPNDRLRKLALGLAPAAAGDSARVALLFSYCRDHLRVLGSSDADTLQRAGMAACDNADAVLRQGGGTAGDANRCFAALARAAGLEVRLVRLSPKTWLPFRPEYTEGWFLRDSFIAVRVGARWIAYDLGARYLPAGMVLWEEENQIALLCSRDSSNFVLTPGAVPERSSMTRVADLVFDPRGQLSGTMRIEVTGHLNERIRREADGDDDVSLVHALEPWTGLDVDPAAWDSARVVRRDPAWESFAVEVPVRWPAHPTATAGATAEREWIEPGALFAGVSGRLSGTDRKLPISFPHAWAEHDTLRIALPHGWHTEPIDEPRPVEVPDFARHDVTLRIEPGTGRLLWMRALEVGTGDGLDFPRDSFDGLKRFFDLARDADRVNVPISQATHP